MSTPSQELAAKLVSALVAEGLFLAVDAARLCASIADGTMRAEDWRLAVEKATSEVDRDE